MLGCGLVLCGVFRLVTVSLIVVVSLLAVLSFGSLIIALSVIGIVIVLLAISLTVFVVLFPLLVLIIRAFGGSTADILLLGLYSSERVWRLHVFVVVFTVWGFWHVLNFPAVIVVSVVVTFLVVVIAAALLVLIREVEFYQELTFLLAFNNICLG